MNIVQKQNAVINFLGLKGRKIDKLVLTLEAREYPMLEISEYVDLPNSDKLSEQEFVFFLREKVAAAENQFNLDRMQADAESKLSEFIRKEHEANSCVTAMQFSNARRRFNQSREEWRLERLQEAYVSERQGAAIEALRAMQPDMARGSKI